MKRPLSVFLICSLFAATPAKAADTAALSLNAFLGLARAHHPQLKIAAAQEGSERAALSATRAALLPQVGFSAQAARTGSKNTTRETVTDGYSAGITANQLVCDFGRTGSQVRQAGHVLTATQESARSTRQSVLLSATIAYFNVLLAEKSLKAAQESLRQSEEHLLVAQTLFEIGKQPKFAVTKAEVDVANARVAFIKAQSAIEKALIGMEQASGVALSRPLRLSDSLEQPEDAIAQEQAFSIADSLRPDILGAVARLEAARMQVRAARSGMFPQIGASAGCRIRSPDAIEWSNDWNIGLTLTQPLYQGGALSARVAQAQASLEQAQATLDLTRQTVHAELRQLVLDKAEAAERAAAAEKLIIQATEGLAMSQERYRAGAATFIEVTDAEVALYNATIARAQALYDYRVAHAKLVRAMGIDR